MGKYIEDFCRKIPKLVLTFALFISLTSNTVSADNTNNSTKETDSVILEKEATPVPGSLNEWEIDLKVKIKSKILTQDIVLVIDKSTSMDAGNKIIEAKKAAKAFINTIIPTANTGDNRIAIVSFGSRSGVDIDFTKDSQQLNSKIDGIFTSGATMMQGGLRDAELLLNNSTADRKIIVFLGDGAPTNTYELSSIGKAALDAVPLSDWEVTPQTKTNEYWEDSLNKVNFKNSNYYKLPLTHGLETSFDETHYNYSKIVETTTETSAIYDVRDGVDLGTAAGIRNYEKAKVFTYNLYSAAIAQANIAKSKGISIHAVALDLGKDPSALHTIKNVADPGNFYQASGNELVEIFKQIAASIVLPISDISLTDPMGEGFTISSDVAAIVGSKDGLVVENNTINWSMSAKNFKFNPDTGYYEMHIRYKVKLNNDAIGALNNSTDGRIPTNGNANLSYTDDKNKDQVDSFPVPQVVPTIIEITKKLFDDNNVEQSLQDQSNQRSYQYELRNASSVLKSGSLNHTNPKEYYIPYTEEALTITETGVVNDNIDRFETKYFLTNASNPRAELVDGSFDVVSNTGMNTLEINNTVKKNFVHDFSVAKNVTDSNGDSIAERGEILNYSITVTNNSDKVINSLSVKDEFSLIKDHVDFNNGVSVKLNGVELARSYTIENLMSGIDIFLNPHDVLTIDFKVTVKNHLIPDMLENTAYVGDKSASATIETGQPLISSKKDVLDANGDGFATPGEVLNYSLTANNSGTVSANSLLIKDDLSSILTHVNVLDTDKVTVSINDVKTGSYTIADLKAGFSVELKPGETVKVSFSVTVKADLDVTTVTILKNIATVGETTPEVEIPTGKPLIESNKSVIDANGDGLAAPGEILTYTLNASNKGTIIADALLIKDDLSSMLAHVDVNDTDKVTVSINDVETGTYTIADLKAGFGVELRPGETVKVSFTVTVKDDLDVSTVTSLKNIATVGETTPEVEIPTGKPQVESNKAVVDANGDGFATPGETISYKISAINKGKVTAENIIIKDDLSGVIDRVDTSSTVVTINNNGNITTHTLAELQSGITVSLASGKELSVTFSVTVNADLDVSTVTSLKNIATVGETTPEVEIPTGKPQVESSKTVVDANGDGLAAPGEVLDYTLTATNKGTIIADSLLIKDDLASVQPYVDVLDTDKVTVSINDVETGTYTIADLKAGFNIVLKPGETIKVSFSVTVKADLDVTTVTNLKNIATVGETTPEVEIPTGKPEVESNKTVVDASGDGFATPREVLNYSISAINKGKVTAENIIIKDDLSGVVDHVDASNTVVTVNNDGNITTHTLAELQSGITVSIAGGKEVSVTFSVTVKADLDVSTVTNLKNIATVGETTPEVEIPTGKPQVESNKVVVDASGDAFATPGEVLNYTLSAINKGKVAAENIIIKDDLSGVIDYVDTSNTVVTLNNDGNITSHTLAELQSGITVSIASGKEVSVTFSVTVKADLDVNTVTSLKNIATVGETTPEVEIPTGKPQVESNKAVGDANGDGFATPGETISYKISAINKGKVTAENIIIKDDLSGVIDHVDTSSTVVTLNNDGNITTHTLAELQSGITVSVASGKELTVSFSVTVKADLDVSVVTSLKNIATVGETTPEVEIPTGKPLIESDKTVADANGDGLAAPGEVLDYTLTATNKGDIIDDALHIKDDLSSILTHVNALDTDKVTVSINGVETGSYTIADLKAGFSVELRPGETVTVSFKVTVQEDLDVTTVTSLKNIATVGETTPEVEIPTGKPQVESNKAVADANGDGLATPGEVLNYTLSAINKGKVTAENIIIKDDLSGVINHVDTSNTVVTLNNDGNITTHTLAELQSGITVSIASGKEISVTFSVTVKADLDVATVTSLKNIATVGETTPEVEIPTGKPQVESNKTVIDANGDGFATPGEVLNYSITAINKGKVAAENIIIKDDLSGVIDHVDTSSTIVTLNNDGNITTYTLAELQSGITVSLGSGKELTVSFSVSVKEDLDVSIVTNLKNIATVGETTPEVEIPTGKPLIESNKVVVDANGDGFATPGEVLDYTLTATNKGDIIADALLIKDDLSSILAHVDVNDTDKVTVSINDVETGTYTIADLKVGFSVELKPGETVTVSFSVTVKADLDVTTVTSLKNIATVGETTPEVEIPTGKPLIESNKTVADANGDGYATPGEVLDYTLTATNKGDIIADALLIKDDLSSILAHVDVLDTDKVTVSINDVEAGSYTIADLKAGFNIGLRPGETVTVSFSVTVKADLDVTAVTTLKNIATVGETTPEVEIPTGKPQVESNKAVGDANGDGFATPGEVLDYTLSATNKGEIIADSLLIKDDLANVQPYVNVLDTDKVTVSINDVETGTYTIADLKAGFSVELKPGETVTVSFTVTVKADLDVTTVTSLKNIATVGETTPEVEIPTGKPLIDSNKAVGDANGDGYATPGEILDYTLTATNKGDIIADALQIKDDLANVQPYVNVLDTDKVTVSINDVETGTYTIADLKAGFSVELRPGETVTVSFSVSVKEDLDVTAVTTLKNIATVGETTPEVEIPTGKPLIESNKVVVDANGDGFATPGEVLDYTLTATNKGDIIADALLIKDDLSSILAHVDVLDADKVTVSINDVETGTYTISDLKSGFSVELRPGETVTVSFSVTVKADLDVTTVTTLKNIATVGETTPEVEIPTGKPLVESNKAVTDENGDGFATPGEVLNYTLTATNKGDIIADSLLIKDDLSSILAHVDVLDTDKVTVSINDVETGSYTIADLKSGFNIVLKPGETVKVSFSVTVKADLDVTAVTNLKNIATVGETTPEVEIPTGKPLIDSNKVVADTNGDGYATPGEVLDYTLTATNKGDIIADALLIKDDLSSILAHVDVLDTDKVTVSINDVETGSYTIADLKAGFSVELRPGETVKVSFSVSVKEDLDVSTVTNLKNIATVGETTPEVEIPTGKPQVESKKAVVDANGDGYATPGEVLNYSISAINKGKVTAENIIIKDDLSGVIDHVDTSNTIVTLNNDGNITTHTLAELQSGITVSLASGKELSVTFSVTVKADLDVTTVTILKNIATVGETTPEVEIPTGKPLIDSNKAVVDASGDGFATPGEVLDYTLTATNKGDIIADALLMKDDLSSMLAHVDVLDTDKVTVSINDEETGSYTIADLKAGFSVGLKPGETVKVSFKVTVKADLDVSNVTTLKNIATVGETTPEVEIPTGKPQVESNKAVVDANGDGYATPGEVLNYSISAINKGKVTAENIIIKDDLSGVINHVDISNTVVTLNNDGNITTHTLAELQSGITVSLGSGKELTVSFSVTVKSDLDVSTVTTLKNIATVGETTPEVKIPTGKPLIESNKEVVDANGDGYATPGEVLEYTLTATNKGDIIADALLIKDDLSSILTHVDVLDSDKVTVSINGVKTGAYTIADLKAGFNIVLKPGETVKVNFSVTVKVDLDVTTVTTLKNIATVGETTPEVEIPTGKPLVESNKAVVDANGDGYATPGEVLDYTLTATNKGDIIADSLLIKDDLANVQPYVNVSETDKATVSINGVKTGNYTIADLKSGFNIVLKPGETVKVSFSVTVKADLDVTAVTTLKNIATVGETTPEVEIPTGKPLVESNKAVADANGDGYATPGEVLNYTLTATNKGDIIADSLLIKDDLANVQPYVNVSNSDKVTVSINNVETGKYTIADLKSGFNIVLKPGETVEVSFKVTVKSDIDVNKVVGIKNIATIGETTPEVEIPTGKPDTVAHLEVVDTDGDGYVSPGEDFVYALYIENKSDKVTDSNLLIRDTQESISKIVKQLDGIEVTVNIDGVITVITMEEFMNGFEIDLGPKSKVVITFTVTAIDTLDVIAIPQIDKTAQVGTLYPSASIETGDKLISSDKAVTDLNGDGYAAPGEILSYTITANNSGLVAAHDFIIKDDLSSLLEHIENPLNNNIIVNNNGQITTYLLSELMEGIVLDVASKSTVTVDFDVKVREDLDLGTVVSIRNKATVGETTPEVEIPVSDVNLVSEKTVIDENSNGLAASGELLSYTISVVNKGNATANNVFIKDTLENVLPYVENIDNTLVTVINGEDVFTAPLKDLVLGFNLNIKSGVKVTISFSVKVRNDIHDLGAVEIRNVAQVGDNTPEVTIPVEPQPVEKLPGAGLGNEILNLSMFSVTLGSVLLFLSPFRRRKQKQN